MAFIPTVLSSGFNAVGYTVFYSLLRSAPANLIPPLIKVDDVACAVFNYSVENSFRS